MATAKAPSSLGTSDRALGVLYDRIDSLKDEAHALFSAHEEGDEPVGDLADRAFEIARSADRLNDALRTINEGLNQL